MDYREAIRILHPNTADDVKKEFEYYGGFDWFEKYVEEVGEACILACGAMESVVEALEIINENKKSGEWIPLSKSKPEEGQSVHISAKMGYVEEGLYTKRYGFSMREGFICDNGKFMDIREANAWMPKMKLRPYIEEMEENKYE